MGYAHEYAHAVLHRGRVPMEPTDHVVNWADGPRRGKYYPHAEAFALPDTEDLADVPIAPGLLPGAGGPAPEDHPGFGLPLLSAMLKDSYGLTGRRLGVQANTDLAGLPYYHHANWSRGTAGGGGLYPVSVHWASGPSGPLTPGLHHYDVQRHALQRLLTGDVTGRVREALGPDAPDGALDTDQYLILGVKYWQNSFKYNSFCFHVVSTDLGTLAQTWRIWAAARGLRLAPVLWFDEPALNGLLAVEGEEETVFAVVPLHWGGPRTAPPGTARTDAPGTDTLLPAAARTDPRHRPAVRHRDAERSRTLLDFPQVRAMHRATLEGATARPAPGALASATALTDPADGGARVPLPGPVLPGTGVRRALRERRSSFGRFDARREVSAEHLSAVLAACAGTRLAGDSDPSGEHRLARLYAFVNHVAGIGRGAYAYDPDRGDLRPVVTGPQGPFLQANYFLANYNLEQAGAVLVPTVRTTAVLDAVGDRGYRLAVATAGAVAQGFYLAASALGLGAGVALGFDNVSYAERLGLTDGDEAPLLIMALGHERPGPADFRHEIA
ncbi:MULTISPECIES: nitroreductase family protein [unclassified Streptomyces]|uniref:nitroreductase family protein n=1 Tax=unclassified Streptomyces TaxID=2593676 RepID=UPI0006B00062|nr:MULTISPECIES: nitroreductase family protein [unclassified Streptomyces]KOX19415.1 nitroreductase [Streptomyces sp. NRRL F-6491]KOX37500.1 nitroreductase [Streptomyces sp. NRRL F-6492]